MSYVRIDKNEILFCGRTNSEIGLYVRYKAICDHLQIDKMNWQQVCFNFTCKERKVISKMFDILPDVEPKQNQSKPKVKPINNQSKSDLSPMYDQSKSDVGPKKDNKNNKVAIYNNINNIYNKTKLDYTIPNTLQDKSFSVLDISKIPKAEKQNEVENLFNEFWSLYTPVRSSDGRVVSKGSKEESKKKFIKILNEGENYANIIKGLRNYIEFCRANNQLTCGVTVFLNQKRWLDDYHCETVNAEQPSTKRQEVNSVLEPYAELINQCAN